MEEVTQIQSPPGLTMKLRLANSYGVDVEKKLDNVGVLVESKIENITKSIMDQLKVFADNIEKTTLYDITKKIESSLETKRSQFFSSILEVEEASKSAIAKIRSTVAFLDQIIPDPNDPNYEETIHTKKARILSDLLAVEEAARDSIERMKPVIQSIEKAATDRLDTNAIRAVDASRSKLEEYVEDRTRRFLLNVTQINEMISSHIAQFKVRTDEISERVILDSIKELEKRFSRRKESFDSEMLSIQESISSFLQKSKDRLLALEKDSIFRFEAAVEDKVAPKIDLFSSELLKIESLINEKISGIIKEVEKTEAKVIEKLDISTEHLFEKKRARFLGGIWTGEDLGSEKSPARNIYTKGEAVGLRLENCKKSPESSGTSIGRISFLMPEEKVVIDCGWGSKKISVNKIAKNIYWPKDGVSLDVDLSQDHIVDARDTLWQLCDNENGYERIPCRIRTSEKNKLNISVEKSLDEGAYRLIGVE